MSELKLTSKDKNELLKYIDNYSEKISMADIREIEGKLKKKLNALKKSKKLPAYAFKMFQEIEDLALLLESREITNKKLDRVIAALHYFIWPEDKIADYVPVVGYLDDAFIINAVYSEVRNEIAAEKKRNEK